MSNINIRLTDDTKDGRFAQTNTSDDIIDVATQPKTATPTKGASTPNIVAPVNSSNGLMNQATSGVTSRASSVASGLLTPTAIALTALQIARKVYKDFEEMSQKLNEYDDLRLRAGGTNRGQVNQVNMRRRVIGGRVTSGFGSYVKR